MGNTESKQSSTIHKKITEELANMISEASFWSNDDICNKMSIVYYDKLIQFNRSDIVNESQQIGIKVDVSQDDTKKLCVEIISHYRKRLELLKDIHTAITESYRKLSTVTTGPICKNVDKYVDNFLACQQANGLWVDQDQLKLILKKINKSKRASEYRKHLRNMDSEWIKCISKLQKAMKIIKQDIENKMSDDAIDDIKKYCQHSIEKMNKIIDVYHLLISNF